MGLINIPIKLYTAISKQPIKLSRICKECGSPVGYINRCKGCGKELVNGDWDMGYEIEKGSFVRIEKEAIDAIKIESQETIQLFSFIPVEDLNPLSETTDKYFVGIAEKKNVNLAARTAYSLLREVLTVKHIVGIGKLCMRGKESLVSVKPYKQGLVLAKLTYCEQIRDESEVFFEPIKTGEQEFELASKLVEQYKEFRYEDYKDDYLEALMKLIEGEPVRVEEKSIAQVGSVDLLEQLKASVEA